MRWRPQRLITASVGLTPAPSSAAVNRSAASSRRSASASMAGSSAALASACKALFSSPQGPASALSRSPKVALESWRSSSVRVCSTRSTDAASRGAASSAPLPAASSACSLTMRCDSMRSCPARFTPSALRAPSMTCCATWPRRRLACMAAVRSTRKASSSGNWRTLINRPLARSTSLRSS